MKKREIGINRNEIKQTPKVQAAIDLGLDMMINDIKEYGNKSFSFNHSPSYKAYVSKIISNKVVECYWVDDNGKREYLNCATSLVHAGMYGVI
jgi:hypothetical protein